MPYSVLHARTTKFKQRSGTKEMVLEIHERFKDFNEIYHSQSAEDQVPLFTQTQQLFPKCNIKIILGAKESIMPQKSSSGSFHPMQLLK